MRVRRDSCQSGERVGGVWCERVRCESWERESCVRVGRVRRESCASGVRQWGQSALRVGRERERVALESW